MMTDSQIVETGIELQIYTTGSSPTPLCFGCGEPAVAGSRHTVTGVDTSKISPELLDSPDQYQHVLDAVWHTQCHKGCSFCEGTS